MCSHVYYICVRVCACVRRVHTLYVCMYKCMYVCMYVFMYVCEPVCLYACVYVRVFSLHFMLEGIISPSFNFNFYNRSPRLADPIQFYISNCSG